MSSSEPQRSSAPTTCRVARPLSGFAVGIVLAVVPLIAACGNGGFRPLHADFAGSGPVSEKLAAMRTSPIPGRVGQQLRNELIFHSTGGDAPPPASYRLDIVIQESVSSMLVQRDAEAESQVFNLSASFRLVRLSDEKVILSGSSSSRAGFDRFQSIYANVRARRDAEDRAAKTMATDLKARLSAFLATAA